MKRKKRNGLKALSNLRSKMNRSCLLLSLRLSLRNDPRTWTHRWKLCRYYREKDPGCNTTPPESSKLSERLPDPEKFNGDRKDLRRFTQQIYSKVTTNADRLVKANDRLAYIVSRLTGTVYSLILRKVKYGIYQFVDYPQMLEYLDNAFGDLDRVQNAQNDFFRLRQKNTDFNSFALNWHKLRSLISIYSILQEAHSEAECHLSAWLIRL